MRKLILATRGSELAIAQAEEVKRKLLSTVPELEIEFLEVVTSGDAGRKSQLSSIDGNGLFIREIEEKLISGEADIAVHSAENLHFEIAEGLIIGGALSVADLEKIELDLSRLSVSKCDAKDFIPAACQGMLAVECRKADEDIRKLLADITDYESMLRFEMERYLLGRLKSDCSVPMGIHADIDNCDVELSVMCCGKYVHKNCVITEWRRTADEIVEELCLDK